MQIMLTHFHCQGRMHQNEHEAEYETLAQKGIKSVILVRLIGHILLCKKKKQVAFL